MNEQIFHNDGGIPLPSPASSGRVVDVEIDELILDGFGPLDSRPADWSQVNSGRPNARHPYSGRLNAARAAEAFRRELARELAATVTDLEAGQLAQAITDAVFRQLAARPRGGAR
jgi:hypothetical protein